MTNEKRETVIKWLQNEIRSLRLAPTINGCGPENWADLLEIMQTCLEAVRAYPPAHIDREGWEPCEWCGDLGDSRYKLYAGFCMQKAADDIYEEETEKLNYCPKCGRPLTEEAWAELEKRLRG